MNAEKELRIRGMVCGRCIEVVKKDLTSLGVEVLGVSLGSAMVKVPAQHNEALPEETLKSTLERRGFSLLTDRKATLVQGIKDLVKQTLSRSDLGDSKIRFSDLIQGAYELDYDTLSALFSSVEGITLEKYIIQQRLERVKKLLTETDMTLADIAYQTGFSSVQHLSNQFKQLTSITPSLFRDRQTVENPGR